MQLGMGIWEHWIQDLDHFAWFYTEKIFVLMCMELHNQWII